MNYIIYPEETTDVSQLGGKAGALAALQQANFPVPAWFALSSAAFQASLTAAQRQKLAQYDGGQPAPLEDMLADIRLNPDIEAALAQALARLCPQAEPVAVRSSAPDEDGQRHSFAGQLQTFLDVPHHQVAARVVDVWRSGYSRQVLAYRCEHRLPSRPQPLAVIIQRMVKADASGVAFSADPVSGRRDIAVVAAVRGSGVALVSGEVDADTYRLDRQGRIIDRRLAAGPAVSGSGFDKCGQGRISDPLQTASIVVEQVEQATIPVLTDAQIQAVANLARQVEQFFGCPQDIEWAIEDGRLYLLQARPITTLSAEAQTSEVLKTSEVSHPAPPDGFLNLWDNSNIAESYPGVTTPLTFSFARRAYEEVYRQFCRMMGVPAGTIAGQASTFRRMLGLMQGRIYYNLLSWYRVLALLPGYKLNRRFMEQMMGVKEPLPDELAAQQTPSGRADRLRDGLYLLRTLIGLVVNFLLLPRRIAAFYQRLNAALGPGRPDLSRRRPDELVAYYRDLEEQLLTRWDAPLINDFFAMIFYGVLRKLTEKWCGDAHGTLQNQLLSHTGDIISAEPARRIRTMAGLAAADPAFTGLLCAGSLPEILARLPEQPAFLSSYQAYLDKFGDRCLEELKLESPTLHDDPLLLLRSIGQLAAQTIVQRSRIKGPQNGKEIEPLDKLEPGKYSPTADPQLPTSQSFQAQQRIDQALARHPLRRLFFNWVLKNARRLIRNRENLRFERTRLFGRARMIFLELGRRYQALGLLADPRDIFYLEVEEALGLVDGLTVTTNLQALVALRQAEFEAYRRQSPLPNRFQTRGIPSQNLNASNSDKPSTIPVIETSKTARPKSKPGQNDPSSSQNPKSKIANPPVPGTGAKSLRGLGCSPGIATGPVRIVTDPKSAILQPGDILVASRTDPGWILLFASAGGLLVEHGSLLSHSAIVSRELGLPAIVSLPGLTGWLQDGDRVEFDGSTGIVTKL